MKKNVNITLAVIILSLFSISSHAGPGFGKKQLLVNDWEFILNPAAALAGVKGKWQTVNLPHDWSVKGRLSPTLASCTGYLPGGVGWYRKDLNIPDDWQGKKLYIYFEGVYNRSEVYLNGRLLGKRPNGYVSFMYDLTPYIKYGEKNTLAVRVDHSRYADSRWYTGSGIYRNVYLVQAGPVHIAQWGVYAYPKSAGRQAVLAVEVEVENNSDAPAYLTVNNELLSPGGKIAAKKSKKISIEPGAGTTAAVDLKVADPRLWSLEDPHLYQLRTTILENGKVIDQSITATGFRTFAFDPDKGFALNGQQMKMKGVCLHHDAGVLGAAVPRSVWKRRLLTLKEIGVNAIRTTHNPQAPDVYHLCDELGLLVLNEAYDEWEFPKRKWIEGWNAGTPGFEGSYDFFKEWGRKDLADMVRRDRNHLSVFAWSIGNEVDYPNDPYSHPVLNGDGGFTQAMYGGYQKDAPDANRLGSIAKQLAAVVKQYDKSRPVTAGLAGVAMSNQTEYPACLDIAGYNYTESRYDSDHAAYPERVIYGSENRHDMDAWKAVRDREHIFGQFLWTGIDYLGESGSWPSRGLYVGLVDYAGWIKPRGYFRQSLWSDKPMAYLGTYPTQKNSRYLSQDAWPVWNYEEGQLIRVVCYTNAAEAYLLLNGEVVGGTKKYDDSTGIIYWDIPYRPGRLEVAAMDQDGSRLCSSSIQTSGRPHALKIAQADNDISSEKGLAQIVLQVVDENGIPVMLSDDEITCRISGPGRLLGLESGSNSDMSDYTDNKHRVFHGRLLAYIQAAGKPGKIKVKFTSPWLEEAETEIVVRELKIEN